MRESRFAASSRAGRRGMPQIVIEPLDAGFAVRVGGRPAAICADELDARHWGKHAFEGVNQGLHREIERAMRRLCLTASRFNLHR